MKTEKKTILLVEDEAIIAMTEKIALEKYGYSVITVHTGEQAVAVFHKTEDIDLILMDIDLGKGIDGTEAAAIILNKCDIPVVFCSSHTEADIVEKTEKITSYGYVVKNSGITVLDASIKMAFKLFEANIKITNSESKQKALLSNISDVIGIIGVDGIIKYKSSNIEKWFGWKPEDLAETYAWITVHPDDLERIQKEFKTLLQTDNSSIKVEYRYKCKDDSFKWIELTATNLVHDPVINGVIINYHDISERKQTEEIIKTKSEELEATNEDLHATMEEMEAVNEELFVINNELIVKEKALIESEEKFRLLYMTMDQGMAYHEIITDKEGTPVDYIFLDINDSYTRLLGVTREMAIGRRIKEVIPDVEQYWIDDFGKVALTGERSNYYENYLETTGKYYSTYSYCPKKNYFAVLVTDITDRKQAEEKLKENKVTWSDEVAAIHEMPAGYSPVLQDGFNFYAPEWHEKITKLFNNCAQNGISYDDELEIVTANKKRVWVRVIGEAVKNEQGNIFKVQGAFQDISERKQVEAALRENEESLTVTLQSIGDAVIATDNNGYITRMNKTAERMTEWSLSEAGGKPLLEIFNIVNAQTGQVVENPVKKVLENGEIVGLANHTVLISRSGIKYQIADSAAPIRKQNGEIIGVVLVFSDVTEKYKTEQMLLMSEKHFKTIFNAAPLGIAVIDSLTGHIYSVNPMFAKIAGRSIEEMENIDCISITHPDDLKESEELLQKHFFGESAYHHLFLKTRFYRLREYKIKPSTLSLGTVILIRVLLS